MFTVAHLLKENKSVARQMDAASYKFATSGKVIFSKKSNTSVRTFTVLS
jgi:hypothetical protein